MAMVTLIAHKTMEIVSIHMDSCMQKVVQSQIAILVTLNIQIGTVAAKGNFSSMEIVGKVFIAL